MISLKYSFIKKLAFIYISLPLICFFVGWLKWYYAIPSCLAVIISIFFIFFKKDKNFEEKSVDISYQFLVTLISLSLFYCLFCGIGRLWAQSKDYPWRNAIFRDIILRDWPVVYEKYEGALSYYISLWLPPALIGKLSLLIGLNADLAFKIGNIALLIYSAIGISILFLLIVIYLKPAKKYQLYLVLLIFIFFSGMDILGSIEPLGANNYHLEWWADRYQYSSFTTCMCWVFNQSIIPWICMLLIISEIDVSYFVFIGMCCLLSGPLPFIGLFIYCVSIGFYRLYKSIKGKLFKEYIKDVFSLSNVAAAFFIFPFIGFYLLSNASFQGGGGVKLTNDVVNTAEAALNTNINSVLSDVTDYLLFILVEFLTLMILLFKKNRKNYLYYVTLVLLLIFPFIKVGYAYDFTMRSSIPSLLYLYLLCCKFLFEDFVVLRKQKDELVENKKNIKDVVARYSYIFVIVCLVLGAFTPSVEFIRGFRQVRLRGVDDIMTDYLYTLGEDSESSLANDGDELTFTNFVSVNYKESTFFSIFSKAE